MKILIFLLSLSLIVACLKQSPPYKTEDVKLIKLAGKFADKKMEVSGMDWYGDTLFILPQIPSKHNNRVLFSTRNEIQNYLDQNEDSLLLHEFDFIDTGVAARLGKIPDYEAIAFKGDSVYLLIESDEPADSMFSYIIMGLIDETGIRLQSETLMQIPIKKNLFEMACETLLIGNNKIYIFYEANGANINYNPKIFCFDLSLRQLESIEFENIEYRITDATKLLDDNSFWIINSFWPEEEDLLKPAEEAFIPSTKGINKDGVKRLIYLELQNDKIKVKNYHPKMLPPKDWNWEGLVLFDSTSFLIINDSHSSPPNRTELAYIALKNDD